jgi:hypothetical protein
MIKCGSFGIFGYIMTAQQWSTVVCKLDYAVVPFAYFYSSYRTAYLPDAQVLNIASNSQYSSVTLGQTFDELNQLPTLIMTYYLQSPDTLQKYMAVLIRSMLHSKINDVSKPVYDYVGVPKQIYNLTKWGAYEVPFGWWFRCCWLGGFTMNVYEIGNDQCPTVGHWK